MSQDKRSTLTRGSCIVDSTVHSRQAGTAKRDWWKRRLSALLPEEKSGNPEPTKLTTFGGLP